MPQFEVQFGDSAPTFVRARDAEDAVREAIRRGSGLTVSAAVELGEPEPGSGWMSALVAGEHGARVRPRDRMRFRRD